jgi:hypothetical protein
MRLTKPYIPNHSFSSKLSSQISLFDKSDLRGAYGTQLQPSSDKARLLK